MAVNVRLLQARKELVEKFRSVQQGFVDKRQNYEKETQDIAAKTNKSEAARTARKASMDAKSAKAEMELADKKAKSAAIGMVLGGISAVIGVAAALVKELAFSGPGKDETSKKVNEKAKKRIEQKKANKNNTNPSNNPPTNPSNNPPTNPSNNPPTNPSNNPPTNPSNNPPTNPSNNPPTNNTTNANNNTKTTSQKVADIAKTIEAISDAVEGLAQVFGSKNQEFNAKADKDKAKKGAAIMSSAVSTIGAAFKDSFNMVRDFRKLSRDLADRGINVRDVMTNGRIDRNKLNEVLRNRSDISDSDKMALRTQAISYQRSVDRMQRNDFHMNGNQVMLNENQRAIMDKVRNGKTLTEDEQEELDNLARDLGIDPSNSNSNQLVLNRVNESDRINEAIRAAETGNADANQIQLLQEQGMLLNSDGTINQESLQQVKKDFYGVAGMAVESNFDNTEQGRLLRRAQDLGLLNNAQQIVQDSELLNQVNQFTRDEDLLNRAQQNPNSLSSSDKQRLQELGVLDQNGNIDQTKLNSKKSDIASNKQKFLEDNKQRLQELGVLKQDGTIDKSNLENKRREINTDKNRLQELGVLKQDGTIDTQALNNKKQELALSDTDKAALKQMGVIDSNGNIDVKKASEARQDAIYATRNLGNDVLNRALQNPNNLSANDKKILKGLGLLDEQGNVKTSELNSRIGELRDLANINDFRREQSANKRREMREGPSLLNSFGILGINAKSFTSGIQNLGRDISAYFKDLGSINSFGGFFRAISGNGDNLSRNRALGNNQDAVMDFADNIKDPAQRERFLETMANAGGNADIAYNRQVSNFLSSSNFTVAGALIGNTAQARDLLERADRKARGDSTVTFTQSEQKELERLGVMKNGSINTESIDTLQKVIDPEAFRQRTNQDMITMNMVLTNGRFDIDKYNNLNPADRDKVDKVMNRYKKEARSDENLDVLQTKGVLTNGSFDLQKYNSLNQQDKELVNNALKNMGISPDTLTALNELNSLGVLNPDGTLNMQNYNALSSQVDPNQAPGQTTSAQQRALNALNSLGITDPNNAGNLLSGINNNISSRFSSIQGRSGDTNILRENGVLNTDGTFNMDEYNRLKASSDPADREKLNRINNSLRNIGITFDQQGQLAPGQDINKAINNSNERATTVSNLTSLNRSSRVDRTVTASSQAQQEFMDALDPQGLFDMMRGSVYEASKLNRQKENLGSKINDKEKEINEKVDNLIEKIDAERPEGQKLTDSEKERLRSELRNGDTTFANSLVPANSNLANGIRNVSTDINNLKTDISDLNSQRNNLSVRIGQLNSNFTAAQMRLERVAGLGNYSYQNVENQMASTVAGMITEALKDGNLTDEEFENITKQFGAEYLAKAFNAMTPEQLASLVRTSREGIGRFAEFIANKYDAQNEDNQNNSRKTNTDNGHTGARVMQVVGHFATFGLSTVVAGISDALTSPGERENNVRVKNSALAKIMSAERIANQTERMDLNNAVNNGLITNNNGTLTLNVDQNEINRLAADPNNAQNREKLTLLKNLGLIDNNNNIKSNANDVLSAIQNRQNGTTQGIVEGLSGVDIGTIEEMATRDLAMAAGRGAVGAQDALNTSLKNLDDDKIKKMFEEFSEKDPAAAASLIIALQKNGKSTMVNDLLNSSDNSNFLESVGNFFGAKRDSTKVLTALANKDPKVAADLFKSGIIDNDIMSRVAKEDPRAMAKILENMSAQEAANVLNKLGLNDEDKSKIVGSMDRTKALALVAQGGFSQKVKDAALGASTSATDNTGNTNNLTESRSLSIAELERRGIVDSQGNVTDQKKLNKLLESMSPEQAANLLLDVYGNNPNQIANTLKGLDKDKAANILGALLNKTTLDVNTLLNNSDVKNIIKGANSEALAKILTSISGNTRINNSAKSSIYNDLTESQIEDVMEKMTDNSAANLLGDLYNLGLGDKAREAIEKFNTNWIGGESDSNIQRMGNILLNLRDKNPQAFENMINNFLQGDSDDQEYLAEMIISNQDFGASAFSALEQSNDPNKYKNLEKLLGAVRKEDEWFLSGMSDTAIYMFAQLSAKTQAKLLENMDDKDAANIISGIVASEGGRALEELAKTNPNKVASILNQMSKSDMGIYFAALGSDNTKSKVLTSFLNNNFDEREGFWENINPFHEGDEDNLFSRMNNEQARNLIRNMIANGNQADAAKVMANLRDTDARYNIFNSLDANEQKLLLEQMIINPKINPEEVAKFLQNNYFDADRLFNDLLNSNPNAAVNLLNSINTGLFGNDNDARLNLLRRLSSNTRDRLFAGNTGKDRFQAIFRGASTEAQMNFLASVTTGDTPSQNGTGQGYSMSNQDWRLMQGLDITRTTTDINGNSVTESFGIGQNGINFNDSWLQSDMTKAEREFDKYRNFNTNLTSTQRDQILENQLKYGEQIGGSKQEAPSQIRRRGFNWAILGLDMSMAGIKFLLEQLDKLREANDQKEEAQKKWAAAKELEAKVLGELKRQGLVGAENMVGIGSTSADTSGG